MALDGIFLRYIKHEIETEALGARVSQIYQPNRDELVFAMRTFTFRAVGVQFYAHEARHARRIAFRGGERLDTLREPLCGGGG